LYSASASIICAVAATLVGTFRRMSMVSGAILGAVAVGCFVGAAPSSARRWRRCFRRSAAREVFLCGGAMMSVVLY
jgi:hypothetical protein